ncbi:hypothetical protein [Actinocorallia aurantiaca]|uniref:Uncharacterized protein n=1 Tax=Actinocorallia aurantiaca TaxID=46204 RepID=A0ABN3UH88_9ACTN
MNDLTFLFFLIPGVVLSISALTLGLALRSHRRFRREMFGEENLSLFAPFFPTSSRGPWHHPGDHGGSGPHHFSGSADHGDGSSYSGHETSHHGHGPSHDYSSSSHDSGSSSSSDSGSSSSFSSDSGSSSSF